MAIVIANYEDYLRFHRYLDETFVFYGYYVVVMIDGRIDEAYKIFEQARQSQIMNIVIAYENDGVTTIETYRPFTLSSCNDTTPLILDKFVADEFLQGTKNFFPYKNVNMFGCPVLVATANDAEPFVFVEDNGHGTIKLYGRDIKLMETLSEKLNFTIVYSHIESDGFLFENGSAGGILKRLLDNETELIIADFWLKPNRLKVFKALNAYSFENVIFVIPQGKELKSYEKIMNPLSKTTWLFLSGTIILAVVVITIIKRYPAAIRHFVFGSHVRSPFFNLLINLIGGVQPRLPRRNFARFILINFVLFALVMRTAYLGSFYNILHSNVRHQQPQTLDELIRRNFVIVFLPVYNDLYSGEMRMTMNMLVADDTSHYNSILDEVATFRRETAVVGGQSHIKQLNKVNLMTREREHIQYQISKERLMMFPSVIYTRKNFFLGDNMNDVIEQLKTSGLIDYWQAQSFSERKLSDQRQPEVIKFEHVEGPFQFLVISLVAAGLAFMIEFTHKKLAFFYREGIIALARLD